MSGQRVQDHYARSGSGATIAARIIAAVRAHAGADMAITPETLAPVDHLHGRGALATEELVALLEPRSGEMILDIGSGLGGPARWIATKFGCSVTGVDLTDGALRRGAGTQCCVRPVGPRAYPAKAARSLCRCRTQVSIVPTRTTW